MSTNFCKKKVQFTLEFTATQKGVKIPKKKKPSGILKMQTYNNGIPVDLQVKNGKFLPETI